MGGKNSRMKIDQELLDSTRAAFGPGRQARMVAEAATICGEDKHAMEHWFSGYS
jgi:hypothetical protein